MIILRDVKLQSCQTQVYNLLLVTCQFINILSQWIIMQEDLELNVHHRMFARSNANRRFSNCSSSSI